MFKNPFSFDGRIRRTEYALSYLMIVAYAAILSLIIPNQAIVGLLFIPAYWFGFAQGAKRCHDRNNSGWFQLIPFYGLWMLFAPGDSGENDYGTDPKAE